MNKTNLHPSTNLTPIHRRDALLKMGLLAGVSATAAAISSTAYAQAVEPPNPNAAPSNTAPRAAAPIPAVGAVELGGLAALAAAVAAYQLRKKSSPD